jgi:hypothetical protein
MVFLLDWPLASYPYALPLPTILRLPMSPLSLFRRVVDVSKRPTQLDGHWHAPGAPLPSSIHDHPGLYLSAHYRSTTPWLQR